MKRVLLAILFLSVVALGNNVTSPTTPATAENPISESGRWINGGVAPGVGLQWGNVQKNTTMLFGVAQNGTFGDPTAVLAGSWGPSQTVQGTIRIVTATSAQAEVELRFRTTITANNIVGYELLCNVSTTETYGMQLVRWKGPKGAEHTGFEYIASYNGIQRCVNGDVIKAVVSGNGVIIFRNGTQLSFNRQDGTGNQGGPSEAPINLATAGLPVLTTGSPGVGFFTNGSNTLLANYGWSTFSANDEIQAVSCQQAQVSSAIATAAVGDTVVVPPGTGCTWTGFGFNKAVTLQGAGRTSANAITLGNNTITKQATGAIRFTNFYFTKTGGGESSKAFTVGMGAGWKSTYPFVFDHNTVVQSNTGLFLIQGPGGVIFSNNDFTADWDDSIMQIKGGNTDPDGSWTQVDTIGTRDQASTLSGTLAGTSGFLNLYIEDNNFLGGTNQGIDCDDGCRMVNRHNIFTNSESNSHGFDTSAIGMRHFEVYSNKFFNSRNSTQLSNENQAVWIRGATGVIYDNDFDNLAGNFWGDKDEIKIVQRVDGIGAGGRPVTSCGAASYPLPRQPGTNWNGTAYFVDPIYMWNNRDGVGYTGGAHVAMSNPSGFFSEWANPCGLAANTYWQANRDFFFPSPPSAGTAKPGYTAFTYPHPFLSGTGTPAPPTLTITTSVLPNGNVGVAYPNTTLAATGGTGALTWSMVSGSLPTGMNPLSAAGLISGTPSAAGTFNFTVKVQDSGTPQQNTTKALSIVVSGTGPSPLPEGNTGIASAFPNDVNIGTAPGVIWADNFDSYATIAAAQAAYSNSYGTRALESNTVNVFGGTGKALRETVPANANDGTGNNAVGFEKNLTGGLTTVFMRVYAKFPSNWSATGSEHNGLVLSGNYCGPGQGASCDGSTVSANTGCTTGTCVGRDNKFYITTENSRDRTPDVGNPGYLNSYAYYPDQRDDFGDHWFSDGFALPNSSDQRDWGSFFVSRPSANGTLDTWTSYEIMVQLNTAGQHDGRVAIWVDGVLKADWQNILIRGTPSNGNLLTIARADMNTYIKTNGATAMNRYYDNLVIATSYIGPVFVGSTFSISGNVAGSTRTGLTMNLTGAATASTTTDSFGSYTFTGLLPGSYTVTPSFTNYTFTPVNSAQVVSNANITGVNFTIKPLPPSGLSSVVH